MSKLAQLFNKSNGTYVRNLIRAIVLCLTAFGLDMSGEQIAGIMLVIEAVFAAGVASPVGNTPAQE